MRIQPATGDLTGGILGLSSDFLGKMVVRGKKTVLATFWTKPLRHLIFRHYLVFAVVDGQHRSAANPHFCLAAVLLG